MNEIANILVPGEKVIWEERPNYQSYLLSSIFGSILFSVLFVGLITLAFFKDWPMVMISIIIAFVGSIIFSLISYSRIHYALTNKRAIIQSGIIGRDFRSLEYDKINNATASVGLVGVIFKTGNIIMSSGELELTGSGNSSSVQSRKDMFGNVPSPYEVLRILQQHLSVRKETLYGGKKK